MTSVETTDYVGNYIYMNNILKRILTENGYIENGQYYFHIKGHLGTSRLVFQQSPSSQAINYYPFGMSWGDQRSPELQPYKYTGKELDLNQGLNLYDYGARFYDPATCQFTTMDPMAEKYYSISPYAYCANNPLKYIDPGMLLDDYALNKENGQLMKIKETQDNFDLIKAGTFDKNGKFKVDESVSDHKVSKGVLKGKLNEDISTKNIIFSNVEEGVDFMQFVSWNTHKELNACAYKENADERIEIGAWDKNTEGKSYPPVYRKDAVFNIHTHPGSKNGTGGFADPSPSDWKNLGDHPYKGHFIISRRFGLVQYSLRSKESYIPIKKETPKSLIKFIR